MPTEADTLPVPSLMHPIAARRILRLAVGTALSLCFSQMINWPLSYITPIFTMFILALPLPVLTLKKGIVFILALLLPMIAAMVDRKSVV